MCLRFSRFHPACGAQATQRLTARNIAVPTGRAHAAAAHASHCSGATPMISPGSTEVTYPKSGQVQTEDGLEKLQLPRSRKRSRSIAHLKLAEDLVQVPFDGSDGRPDLVGDFLIGGPVVEQAQNLTLGFAQRLG